MKKNVFRNMLAFAMAAAISVGFTSCSSNDEPFVITDNDDDKWLVTSIAGLYCTYDEDNKLTSIIDGKDVFYVSSDDKLTITYSDSEENINFQISLNDDNNITKIEYSGIEYGDGKWGGTCDFNYNSDERILSYTATDREESLNGQRSSTSRYTASFTWVNDNLVSWTENETENYVHEGNSETYNSTETYTYTYGGQENTCKQFPYLMGKNIYEDVLDDDISGIFSVLGLFGYGPKYLPISYSNTYGYNNGTGSSSSSYISNYTFSFILNSNGTLNSETRFSEGSSSGNTYNYVYTPTRASSAGTQSFKELLRNSLRRRASLKLREQEQ